MAAEPRHDYYQTDTSVIVSVYVKGCKEEDVKCTITETALSLDISAPSTVAALHISDLFSGVTPSSSSYKVLGSKIEVKLQKADGINWKTLKAEEGSLASTAATVIPAASTNGSSKSRAAPRPHSKWDSFKPEDEDGKEDNGPDDFFKSLYAGADDDARRAMMKSYQESGGTTLSMNWGEVSKKKVDTTPPEGMEARKY